MSTQLSYHPGLPKPLPTVTKDGEPFKADSAAYCANAHGTSGYSEHVTLYGVNDYGRACHVRRDGWTHDDLPEPPQWFIDAARCLQMDAEAGR